MEPGAIQSIIVFGEYTDIPATIESLATLTITSTQELEN
jgi:hypothetical protein